MTIDETGLIAGFYEAAFDPTRFPEMLRQLGDFGDGIGGALLLWDERARRPALLTVADQARADAPDAYYRRYAALDPYRPVIETKPVNLWTTCTDFFDDDFVAKDAFYNEYLAPRGIRYMTASRVLASEHVSAFLGIHRGPRHAPFSPDELTRFERVGRHIGRAITVFLEVSRTRFEHEAASVVLERLARPAMLVDATGRILFANPVAETMLAAGSGLGAREGCLTAERPHEERRLHRLIAAAAARRERSGGEMLLTRPAGQSPVTVLVAPAGPMTTLYSLAPVPAALVLLHDPARHVTPPAHGLKALFGLTNAEATLAVGLLEGKRLTEIADGRGVSIETVRTQLRALFRKTGVSRQTDLMRILLAVPDSAG